MAIIKRTDSEAEPAGTPADGSVAVQDAPAQPVAAPAQPAAAPAQPAPAEPEPAPVAQSLPAALEPELRKIIDTAVARVAAIELEAIKDARELTQRSEQEAREALAFALDRAFNLIRTLELLAATVSGMADALKVELNDAVTALKTVPQPESELAKEMAERQAPQPEPAPQPEAQAAPDPEPEAPAAPEPAPEPAVVKMSEVEKPAQPQTEEQPAAAAAATNGTPHPAVSEEEAQAQPEAQAEPEAEAQAEPQPETQPEPEPEQPARTVVAAPPPPARRRGFMRRLFR